MSILKQGEDDKYHLIGEIAVCSKDTLLDHYKAIKPLMDLVDKWTGILVTPMQR
jgi:hypothetical protein